MPSSSPTGAKTSKKTDPPIDERPVTREWLSRAAKDWIAIALLVIAFLVVGYFAGIRLYDAWIRYFGT